MTEAGGKARPALAQVLEEGGERAAELLGKMTGIKWSVGETTFGPAQEDRLDVLAGTSLENCRGAWFALPGAMILVSVSPWSGMIMTDKFTERHARTIDLMGEREAKAVAEMANILVNAFVQKLAAALGRDLLLSAPAMYFGTRRDVWLAGAKPYAAARHPTGYAYARLEGAGLPAPVLVLALFEPAIHEALTAPPVRR